MQIATEPELVEKLVEHWHLNAQERKALPDQKAKSSLVVSAIQELVTTNGKYPADWDLVRGFDGGLIEKQSNESFVIYWMIEVSMCRFELKENIQYSFLQEACEAYAQRFFSQGIDGIPIDWSA